MKTRYIVIACLFLLTTAFVTSNESSFISDLKRQLLAFLSTNNEEKIYLQTDKTLYKPGEYIWVNAFLTDASTGKASSISNIAYVELYDPKGNLVKQAKLHIQNGTAGAEFLIEDSRPGGLYLLKAYTSWMKNFGEDRFFTKELQVQKVITPRLLLKPDFEKKAYGPGDEVTATLVVTDLKNQKANKASVIAKVNIAGNLYKELKVETNQDGKTEIKFQLPEQLDSPDGLLQMIVSYQGIEESVSRSIPIVLNKINLKFYPEGGTWIGGIQSRMAFEAINEFGKGADVSGEILDENGHQITSFDSFHFGMGIFEFKPEAGKRYMARILKPVGTDSLFALPLAVNGNFSLNLKVQSESSISWNVYAPENDWAYMVAQVNGMIYEHKDILLNKGVNDVNFDTRKLPAGVAIFSLFTSAGIPVCERLVMVNPEKRLNIQVKTDKKNYSPGELIKAEIKTSDTQGNPVGANLSLAVVDEQNLVMADDKQDHILSYLLLSSELKGKIYEPSFYFDDKEKKSAQAIDYLLLTHGWRRFSWNDIMHPVMKKLTGPENIGHIYGKVTDAKQRPVKAQVILVELQNKKRVLQVTSRSDGQFAFLNVDPSTQVAIFTPRPNSIQTTSERPVSFLPQGDFSGLDILNLIQVEEPMDIIREKAETEAVRIKKAKDKDILRPVRDFDRIMENADIDIFLDEKQVLEEVVVVAHEIQTKAMLSGVVEVIQQKQLQEMDIQSALEGKIAGLDIQQGNINPADERNILIRGRASLGEMGSNPIIVVDGIVMTDIGNSTASLSQINPDNIRSIEVLKGAEASALFGSRAANGVIVISTKNSNFPFRTNQKTEKPTYTSVVLDPTATLNVSRSYYELAPRFTPVEGVRSDFRTTVFWKNNIITDKNGEAHLEFYNNEAVSAFRITTEGISNDGLVGRVEYTYSSQLPLSLDAKLPNYLSFGDTLRIPVSILNNTDSILKPDILIEIPSGLKLLGPEKINLSVLPEMSENISFTLVSTGNTGVHSVTIRLKEEKFSDEIRHQLNIYPIGFPHSFSISGREKSKTAEFDITNMEPGSLNAVASVHISVLDELFAGTESILREPYGCFEQVSSITFPNIFALQLMKATGQGDDATKTRAMKYIKNGYDKLMAYEIPTGGFEWFGNPPANEALTAYGLVEFHEMDKVLDGVDRKMMERTKEYLLSRRNPDGTFIQSRGKYDYLSSAPYDVNCAYVIYALTETGTKGIDQSYNYSLKEAEKSKDMYRMALMSLAARNLDKKEDLSRLTNEFLHFIKNGNDFNKLKVESTIVNSYGQYGVMETVSLWAVSLMREEYPDWESVEKCIQYIVSGRGNYGYGSTQATSLALKALTDYALKVISDKQEGRMTLTANDAVYELPFNKSTKGSVINDQIANHIYPGKNKISIDFSNPDCILPYSVIVRWNARTPKSSDKCPLKLSTILSQSTVKQNETVRLSVRLENKDTKKGQPMSMAVIGIPAGLSPQPWQLKELQEKAAFDFYEIFDNKLALYYRALLPGENKSFALDLKADIPGKYIGAASSGYLYYQQEERHWLEGMEVEIITN